MLVEAKSNLARLMATENLIVEERNVPTAYFDPHSRILTVPILNGKLSNELYDLLLGHEVGHALATPADGWHTSIVEHKVNKDILNVCEDARIEKKIKRRFPGLKPSFSRGYRELMEMDFFGVNDLDLNELNFIDRVNLHTKGGSSQNIQFSKEELVLLEEVENTETFEEVVTVARKVQEFMKRRAEEGKNNPIRIKVKVTSGGEGDEDETQEIPEGVEIEVELQEAKEGKAKKSSMDEPKSEGESESVADQNGSEPDEDNTDKDGDQLGSGSASGGKSIEEQISSLTDKNFREKEKSLYDTSKKADVIYSNIPEYDHQKAIVPFSKIIQTIEKENKELSEASAKAGYGWKWNPEVIRANFVKFKNDSNRVVSYLVKEFELRKNADKQSRAKVSKTGELNMNKIYEYKLTDDIFRRMTNVPNGKSHGLVMFIDWSGSMQHMMHDTIKQLLNLVMFCKKVNIPFEVYAFTSQWCEDDSYYRRNLRQTPKVGDIVVNDFHLLNLLSSKMNTQEYMKMASYLHEMQFTGGRRSNNIVIPEKLWLGGTPLNAAIISAFTLIPEFKKDNNLQIVNALFLTDGESQTLGGRYSMVDPKTKAVHTHHDEMPSAKRRSILRDPVTKATAEVKSAYGYGATSVEQTNVLLKLLKQRANCNLIGFFVGSIREVRSAFSLYIDGERNQDAARDEFKKNDTYVITNSGYDEYYFLRADKLDTDDDGFEVTATTTRSLVTAFSKYTGNKVTSRIILNRFIKLIA